MDNDAQGAVMSQQSGSAEKSNTPDGCCPAQYAYCSRFSFGPRGDNVTEVLFLGRGGNHQRVNYHPFGIAVRLYD